MTTATRALRELITGINFPPLASKALVNALGCDDFDQAEKQDTLLHWYTNNPETLKLISDPAAPPTLVVWMLLPNIMVRTELVGMFPIHNQYTAIAQTISLPLSRISRVISHTSYEAGILKMTLEMDADATHVIEGTGPVLSRMLPSDYSLISRINDHTETTQLRAFSNKLLALMK